VNIFSVFSGTVLSSYLIVKLKGAVLMTIGLIGFNFTMGYLMAVWNKETEFDKISRQVVDSRLRNANNSFEQKTLRSFLPIVIKVGSLTQLDKRVVLGIYAAIVDSTITLLVASKEFDLKRLTE
jgi:hypothetical protein